MNRSSPDTSGAPPSRMIAAASADADGPSLGALDDLESLLMAECEVGLGEDLAGARRVEREVGRRSISTDSPNARACARCGCSARLAVTSCEPAGIPPITTPSTSWQAGFCSSCRSSIISTNRVRLARNAVARSGAARPSAEPPCPRMVSANWSAGGMIRRYAEASRTSSAIGSSSNRSSETQATSRVSVLAHWASRVDFPYPAGAVTVTIRRPLDRAASMRSARLTALRRESRGAVSFASSS